MKNYSILKPKFIMSYGLTFKLSKHNVIKTLVKYGPLTQFDLALKT